MLSLNGCRTSGEQIEQPTLKIRIPIGTGGMMNPLAQAMIEHLPSPYREQIDLVMARGQLTPISSPRLIEEGEVELAIIPSNVAYLAYTQGWGELPYPHRKLRSVVTLGSHPLHLIAAEFSGIETIQDLRGKTIATGTEGSTTDLTVRMTLDGIGLSLADVTPLGITGSEAVEAFREGRLDAVFSRGSDGTPIIEQLMEVPGAYFVSISRSEIENIRSHHPFLSPAGIPAGTYGDHPEIGTIGVGSVIVCRDDLPADLVYWIARGLFESLTSQPDSNAFQQLELDAARAAPIPLHAGAARYFRERELFH